MIEEIKQKISIVNLARRFTKLVSVGNGKFKGCCPFHKEKTPSCHFNDTEGYFKCFGCGEGGDIIYFFEKVQNINTKTAIEMLAQEAGIEKSQSVQDTKYDKKKSIYGILNDLIAQMQSLLHNKSAVKQYVAKTRNLKLNTVDFFKIGFLDLNNISAQENYQSDLIEIGFLHAKNYSTFNERLIIPIFDKSGNPIGFGGRQLIDSKTSAKYINSKESYLFNKGKILFNYHNAVKTRKKYIIIVEGYMDVIKMHDVGFENCIAPLGTAFTTYHAEILCKTGKMPIFAFDNDEAGKTAMIKAVFEIAKFLSSTFMPKFMVYDLNYKDLDEIANSESIDKIQSMIDNSLEINEYLMAVLLEKYDVKNPNQKSLLEKEFLGFCDLISDEMFKKNYIRWMKDRIFQESISKNKKNVANKIQNISVDYEKKLKEYELKISDIITSYGITQSMLSKYDIFSPSLQDQITKTEENDILKNDTEEIEDLMVKFIFIYNQSKIKDRKIAQYELKGIINYIKNKKN